MTTVHQRDYTFTADDSPGSGCFEAISASIYKVEIKAERKNSNENGVHRPREGVIRAECTINGYKAYNPIKLKGADTEFFEVIVPRTCSAISFILTEGFGTDSFGIGGATRSSIDIKAGSLKLPVTEVGFAVLGTVYRINKLVASNKTVTQVYFTSFFDISESMVYGVAEGATVLQRRDAAVKNIKEAQLAKGGSESAAPEDMYLTYEEMKSAIRWGGANYQTPADYS